MTKCNVEFKVHVYCIHKSHNKIFPGTDNFQHTHTGSHHVTA